MFTGKSALVMKARNVAARKRFKNKNAQRIRQGIISVANQLLQDVHETVDTFEKYTNAGDHMGVRDQSSHIQSPFATPKSSVNNGRDTPVNMEVDSVDPGRDDPMLICANRTKPANSNKYAKRVGAKQAKKLELSENAEFVLSPKDATTYRALAARCNYLAQDRADISYASKELCREFSIPNVASFKKLKRLARYLAGLPRLIYRFPWQAMPKDVEVFVDTDFAGCQTTRRSTSGGAALLGGCLIKHWSKTQSTISLSSGEAELHGIAMGAAQGIGLQSLLKDLGWKVELKIWSDATAAIGIARRKGLGKIKHLDTTDLWLQDKIRSRKMSLEKILGADNPADVLTKYVDKNILDKMLPKLNLHKIQGRPACAPMAMGA